MLQVRIRRKRGMETNNLPSFLLAWMMMQSITTMSRQGGRLRGAKLRQRGTMDNCCR